MAKPVAVSGCCHLTRRQLLRFGGLVAASPFLSALADVERAYGLTRAVQDGPMVAVNLELVTVTESTATLTWFTGDPSRADTAGRPAPVPADTEVLLGTSPDTLQTVFHDAAAAPYHHVELTGLEPGRPYFVAARSNGVPATPAVSSMGGLPTTSASRALAGAPLAFTTPLPPPGSFLFAIALCNDLHLGETVAGLATQQGGQEIPPGIRQVEGRPPYPAIMSAALAVEARERGAALLLAAGDISAEAGEPDVRDAKSYLDRFGKLGKDYLVARGNHDRFHTNADTDTFRDVFFKKRDTWFRTEVNGLRIIGLDTYDTRGNGGDNGVMSDEQEAFVAAELNADPDRPTLVFGHHPVTIEATMTSVPPYTFDMERQQAGRLETMYAGAPGVFLHHAGHTHRNKRTVSETAPGVVFQEVAAVKEYPGGFHLLRVFTGGYALNFHKFHDPLAQEWAERSRPEYGGLAPFYTFGNASDRNAVFTRDLSGLRPAKV